MTTIRFTVPPTVADPRPAFVAFPPAMAGMSVDQFALVQQVYRVALERTLAVLAPSAVEKLYHRSAN